MEKLWFKIGAAVLFLASFGLILGRNLPGILTASAPDFTQVWVSARALTISREPYLNPELDYPNAYPPISEIFFLPLALTTYHKALAIFTFLSVASIVGSVYLSIRLVTKKVPWYYFLLFMGFSFLSFPTKFSLGMGQVNIIALFLLLLAAYLDSKSKNYWLAAGLSLAAAIILKPIFAFFLLFFFIKKSWKLITISAITVLIVTSISLIFWNPLIWVNWYKSAILPLTTYSAPYIYVYSNQGIFGFLSKMISNFAARIYITRLATIILIAIAVYLLHKSKNFILGLSFFIITLLLFDITSWQHHFVWLMFPFIVLSYYVIKTKNALILGLICLSYFLISWNFHQPTLHPLILRSHPFYGAVILWCINFYFLKSKKLNVLKLSEKSSIGKFFNTLQFES